MLPPTCRDSTRTERHATPESPAAEEILRGAQEDNKGRDSTRTKRLAALVVFLSAAKDLSGGDAPTLPPTYRESTRAQRHATPESPAAEEILRGAQEDNKGRESALRGKSCHSGPQAAEEILRGAQDDNKGLDHNKGLDDNKGQDDKIALRTFDSG